MPCTHSGSASASCTGGQPPGGEVEPDDLQRVLPEPGLDQVRQRQRGLLHRPPAALAAPSRTTGRRTARPPPSCAARSRPPRSPRRQLHAARRACRRRVAGRSTTVRDGVERQLVAELPRPGQAGRLVGLTRCGGRRGRRGRRPSSRVEHPLQRGLAEPSHGARGEPQAVVAAGEVALPLELALQLAQRLEVARRRRRRGAARAARRRRRRGSRRRSSGQLLLERLEVGELGHRLDGVAVAQRLAARPHARPGCRGPARAAARAGCRRAGPSPRRGRRRRGRRSSAGPSCSRCSGDERGHHPRRRRPAGGRGRRSARRRPAGCSGNRSPCLSMNSRNWSVGVLAAGVRGQQRVEVGQHVLDGLHRLGVRPD